ncbi:hypothetical protein P3T27_001403 [Kitasatospora sp. MAA19]|uniref:DoxX family protein n=1 Tax=unclassified Kitasatospora TaxID=2633591 RepID=UPI00247616A6|nr:DoxX family protein [Kitasatospora sp. MAA19]MDH6704700.1 hypothetical protein [Kitasatospora sp. MAA19]
MSVTLVIVTVLAALMAGTSAGAVFLRAGFAVGPLAEYGVPRAWWIWLGVAKAAGAVGLLVGLAVPVIGELAAAGLVLYFTGAVIIVLRARDYAHVPFPVIYAVPAAVALVLGLAA